MEGLWLTIFSGILRKITPVVGYNLEIRATFWNILLSRYPGSGGTLQKVYGTELIWVLPLYQVMHRVHPSISYH